MLRTLSRLLLLAGLASATSGCVHDGTDASGEPGYELQLADTQAGVQGSYLDAAGELTFVSEALDDTSFDIRVTFHGMTVSVLVDTAATVVEYDGYASDNGEDTQMTDEDRALLLSFSKALDSLGADPDQEIELLRRFVSVWAEFPSTKEMHGLAVGEQDRSYTSICWAENSYQQVTHDDWTYDRWDDASTYSAYIGFQAAGPCSDGTYFWTGAAWSCYEPDHSTTVESAYGNCFGRCGASCGSSTQLTWDCADHDSCVRFGHTVASFWCDDEFSSTLDDWAAAPNCH